MYILNILIKHKLSDGIKKCSNTTTCLRFACLVLELVLCLSLKYLIAFPMKVLFKLFCFLK